jgi:hypothetical protein
VHLSQVKTANPELYQSMVATFAQHARIVTVSMKQSCYDSGAAQAWQDMAVSQGKALRVLTIPDNFKDQAEVDAFNEKFVAAQKAFIEEELKAGEIAPAK